MKKTIIALTIASILPTAAMAEDLATEMQAGFSELGLSIEEVDDSVSILAQQIHGNARDIIAVETQANQNRDAIRDLSPESIPRIKTVEDAVTADKMISDSGDRVIRDELIKTNNGLSETNEVVLANKMISDSGDRVIRDELIKTNAAIANKDVAIDALNSAAASNQAAIAKTDTTAAANTSELGEHHKAIANNQELINDNYAAIANKDIAIDALNSASASNQDAIADNTSELGDHHKAIASNQELINGNYAAIASNKDGISTLDGRMTSAEEELYSTTARSKSNEKRIGSLEHDMSNVKEDVKDLERGMASIAAMSMLTQPYGVGNFNVSASVGGYKSEQAIAVGMGYRATESVTFRAGAGANAGNDMNVTWGASVGYEF